MENKSRQRNLDNLDNNQARLGNNLENLDNNEPVRRHRYPRKQEKPKENVRLNMEEDVEEIKELYPDYREVPVEYIGLNGRAYNFVKRKMLNNIGMIELYEEDHNVKWYRGIGVATEQHIHDKIRIIKEYYGKI